MLRSRPASRPPGSRLTALLLVSIAVVVLSACGGDDAEPAAGDDAPAGASNNGAATEVSHDTDASSDADEAAPTRDEQAAATGIDCTAECNIAMDGDSLTEGLGERLCLTVATGNCINSGLSGVRIDQMIESAPADVDNQVGAGTNDVLILWGGTNDLWQQFHSTDTEMNASAAYDQIAQYLDQRRAAGWDYTFVVTLPPMNDDEVAGRVELNELIRANAAGADAVIDLDADPRLADPFDPELREADGVHFTALGANLVAIDHLVPAIRSLGG